MNITPVKFAEELALNLAGSRLVNIKSYYSHNPGMMADGYSTIVIIELYQNKKFTYQQFIQTLGSKDKNGKSATQEVNKLGKWSVKKERDETPMLYLSAFDGEKKTYRLELQTTPEVYLNNEKYIRMSLREITPA